MASTSRWDECQESVDSLGIPKLVTRRGVDRRPRALTPAHGPGRPASRVVTPSSAALDLQIPALPSAACDSRKPSHLAGSFP